MTEIFKSVAGCNRSHVPKVFEGTTTRFGFRFGKVSSMVLLAGVLGTTALLAGVLGTTLATGVEVVVLSVVRLHFFE